VNTLNGILLLVALLGGALGGYKFGARALDQANAQLADIEKESKRAQLEHEAMLQRMEQKLSARKDEYEREAQAQEKTFQAQRLALKNLVAAREGELANVEAKKQRVADELARALEAEQAASGTERQRLQEQVQELQASQEQVEQLRAGLACLTVAVPSNRLSTLNGHEARAERAQR
jgi:hypothetical protein